jgi:hypothetical protein
MDEAGARDGAMLEPREFALINTIYITLYEASGGSNRVGEPRCDPFFRIIRSLIRVDSLRHCVLTPDRAS